MTRLRYSMRWLMALVLPCAAAALLFKPCMVGLNEQRIAARLVKLGAKVQRQPPSGPAPVRWLNRWTNDTLERVHSVTLGGVYRDIDLNPVWVWTGVGDAEARSLAQFSEIRIARLSRTRLTNDGLKSIAKCSRLEELYLDNTWVTDHGLAVLESLPSLRRLSLANSGSHFGIAAKNTSERRHVISVKTKITDAGLKHLAHLDHLEFLDLAGTQITAKGVQWLRTKLPDCEIVWNGNSEEAIFVDRHLTWEASLYNKFASPFATRSWSHEPVPPFRPADGAIVFPGEFFVTGGSR